MKILYLIKIWSNHKWNFKWRCRVILDWKKLTQEKVNSATNIPWFHNLIATWFWKFSYSFFLIFPGEDPRNFWVLPVMFTFSRLEFGKWRKTRNMRAMEGDTELSLFGSMSQIWFRIRRKRDKGGESWVQFLSLEKHAMGEWPKIKCFSMCPNILVLESFGKPFFLPPN